jgi:hypothetical protein
MGALPTALVRLSLVLVPLLVAVTVNAWEPTDHRALGDSAYARVSRWAGPGCPTLKGDSSFGQWCAVRAADDMSAARFHERGRTPFEQLRTLSESELRKLMASGELRFRNVVQAYLQFHLEAMHIAADTNRPALAALREALDVEATAQGYLADGFSSGHMLVSRHNFLASLAHRNNVEAHNYHSFVGVYVVNAHGTVWQAFGDGYLADCLPSYRMVLNACETSLRELLLVWYSRTRRESSPEMQVWADSAAGAGSVRDLIDSWLQILDGEEYLSSLKMPSFMLWPMPVSATWSERTSDTNQYGIRTHRNYSQFREDGFHDPDLSDIDLDFLYSVNEVPDWMVPAPLSLETDSPGFLIVEDPDWASVRWRQHRSAAPSYKGFLLSVEGNFFRPGSKNYGLISAGAGYGLWDNLLLLNNISAGVFVIPVPPGWNGYYVVPNFGFGLPVLGWTRLKGVHFSGGMAIGGGEKSHDLGALLAVGVDSRVYWSARINIGVTFRAKYRWLMVDELLHGPTLEVIIQ